MFDVLFFTLLLGVGALASTIVVYRSQMAKQRQKFQQDPYA